MFTAQAASNRPEVAFETDLPQDKQVCEPRTRHLPASDLDAKGDRKVETGTRLGAVSRGVTYKRASTHRLIVRRTIKLPPAGHRSGKRAAG